MVPWRARALAPCFAVLLLGSSCARISSNPSGDGGQVVDQQLDEAGADFAVTQDARADQQAPVNCSALSSLSCETETCANLFACAAFDLNFTEAKLPAGVAFSRASPAYFVDSKGMLVQAAKDVPRFDHDPETGELLGLQIEGAGENLVPWSSSLDKWTADNAAAEDLNILSPAGDRAFVIQAQGGVGPHRLHISTAPASYTYLSLSFFVKPLRDDQGFEIYLEALDQLITMSYNLNTGYVSTESGSLGSWFRTTSFPGGWQRIQWTGNRGEIPVVNQPINLSVGVAKLGATDFIAADGEPSFAVWGLQLEAQEDPTSYIATAGASGARAPDQVHYQADSAVQLSSGSLLLGGVYRNIDDKSLTPTFLTAEDANGNNLQVSLPRGLNRWLRWLVSGPNGECELSVSEYPLRYNSPQLVVLRADDGQWQMFANGGVVDSQSQDIGTVTLSSFLINKEQDFLGHLRRLSFWDAPLSDDALKVLAR